MGTNVMTTRGSLHRITPAFLKSEAERFRPMMAHLPSPRIAVIVGGTNACYQLTPHEMAQITIQLANLIKSSGGSLMVTPSRRTGQANILIMKAGLHDLPAFVWDGQGNNPYYGMLGLADTLLVTCDSVNLASEACATGKPVHVINLPGGNDKFRRFHQALRDDGMTRPFYGQIETWSYAPLNDTQLVADRIKSMMANPQ
jgi:mitochondrial fission protein ELM1